MTSEGDSSWANRMKIDDVDIAMMPTNIANKGGTAGFDRADFIGRPGFILLLDKGLNVGYNVSNSYQVHYISFQK